MKSTLRFFSGIFTLTFLLAACGDSSEENLETKADIYLAEASQSTTADQFDLGNQHYFAFREMAVDRSAPQDRQKRVHESLKALEEINKLCGETIEQLEKYKSTLLKQVGINASRDIIKSYENSDLLSPSVYSLEKLDPKKKLNNWIADGDVLFKLRQQFRKEAVEVFIKYSANLSGNPLNATIPVIESFKDEQDLRQQIDQAFDPMKIRYDDIDFCKHLYAMLSDDKATYLSYFKTTPSWITQFHLLSICETEILRFRRDYFSFMRSTVNLSCEYDFNEIVTVVDGPGTAKKGTMVKFKVFMVGLNSNNKPILTSGVSAESISIENGYATVTYKIPNASEVTYAGTLSLYNKSGVLQKFPWSKTIMIVE